MTNDAATRERVISEQHASVLEFEIRRRDRLSIAGALRKRNGEPERRSDAALRFDVDQSAHRFDELSRGGQSESDTLKTAGARCFYLRKFLEQQQTVLFVDAD